MAGKRKGKGKKGRSGKKEGSGTKFGKIYGSLVGKGYSNEEAAAIAYKAVGESDWSSMIDLTAATQRLRESLETIEGEKVDEHIVKLKSGQYRLLSHAGKNLGTFSTRAEAEKHERAVEYFKRGRK